MYLNRRVRLLVSVMLSSIFFPVKWHYLVFAGHVFSSFRGFYQKNIVMQGSTISIYIDKKERTLFTCEPNFTARRPFLAEKRRIKTYFPPLITMVITVETHGVCKTSSYFHFDRSRSPYLHTTFIQHLERRRTVPVW